MSAALSEVVSDQVDTFRIESLDNYIQVAVLNDGHFGEPVIIKYHNQHDMVDIVGRTYQIVNIDSILNQFRCEYRLLSTLKHRRIVQCIGAYWDATRIILFDEYLTRGSVKDQLQSQWLLEEKAIKYFFQTADALQYLHANNVIHGEIRASNLMLTIVDNVKLLVECRTLIDNDNRKSSQLLKYLLYQPPEIIQLFPIKQRIEYGKAADIWSLACTLIEMLIRYAPYYEYFAQIATADAAIDELIERVNNRQLPYDSASLIASASTNVRQLVDWIFVQTPSSRPNIDEIIEMRDRFMIDDDIEIVVTALPASPSSSNRPKIESFTSIQSTTSYQKPNDIFNHSVGEKRLKGRRQTTNNVPLGLRIFLQRRRKKSATRDFGICCIYYLSRICYFLVTLTTTIASVVTMIAICIISLIAFFAVAFGIYDSVRVQLTIAGIVYVIRLAIAALCPTSCNMNDPSALIISGIMLILLFAVIFSCCMVALGEFKYRLANRSLTQSQFYVHRPDENVKLCGVTVIEKKQRTIIDDNKMMDEHQLNDQSIDDFYYKASQD